jgi:hypothetical protein
MPKRVVVALHVAWMAVIVALAMWAGWLFRFEGDRGFLYLDRWTGELVEGDGSAHYRYSLRRPVQKEFVVDRVIGDPEGVLTRPGVEHAQPVPKSGAFDDLIPKK